MEQFQNNRRTHIRGVSHKPFTIDNVNTLKRLIQSFEEQGITKHYSILVDSEIIVPKGSNIQAFDNYIDFVDESTNRIEVRMYQGNSPNYKLHIFSNKEQALNGVSTPSQASVEELIQKALEKQRMELELETLRKEVKRKGKKIKKLKDTDEEEAKMNGLGNLITKGIEVLGASKLAKEEAKEQKEISGVGETKVEIETQSESDKQYEKLKSVYSEKELIATIRFWELLTRHPDLNHEINKIIQNKIRQENANTHNQIDPEG